MFLPYYAMYQIRNTTKNGKPLLKRERTVLDYAEHTRNGFFPLSPLFWFSMLMIFTGVVTYFDHKHKTRSKWLDFSLFFVSGLAGLILFLLWVATDHTSTPYNYNILWAFPINIGVAFVFILQTQLPTWLPKYLKGLLAIMGVMILLWLLKVQIFSPILIPLLLTLVIRYLYLIKFSKIHPRR